MNTNKLWYAVMMDREDTDWGTGSFDRDEAESMVYRNLGIYPEAYIAVIDGDVCVEEIEREDFDCDFQYWDTDAVAAFVSEADAWDLPYVEGAMDVLCRRAGRELRDMEDGDRKQSLLDEIRGLSREWFDEDDPEESPDDEDLIDYIEDPHKASWGEIGAVIQHILGVRLGI